MWSIITLWPITFVAYYICGQLLHLWLIITFVVDYYICGQLLHLWLQHGGYVAQRPMQNQSEETTAERPWNTHEHIQMWNFFLLGYIQ